MYSIYYGTGTGIIRTAAMIHDVITSARIMIHDTCGSLGYKHYTRTKSKPSIYKDQLLEGRRHAGLVEV